MVDYEHVVKDIRNGFALIAANKEGKSRETVMKEICSALIMVCEQDGLDNDDLCKLSLNGINKGHEGYLLAHPE